MSFSFFNFSRNIQNTDWTPSSSEHDEFETTFVQGNVVISFKSVNK